MPIDASVTIVMPVFNGMPYLEQAIDSVLAQTFCNWNLIISDNGSSDGSRHFLSNLMLMADDRITIYFQDNNLGIFGNLNFLFQQVHSGLIHILCCDDLFCTPMAICRIVESFPENDDKLGAIRWGGGELLLRGIPARLTPNASQLYFFLFGNLMGNLSNVTCRKEVFSSVGPFNQSFPYVGDFEYWARMANHADILISEANLVMIRRHARQASAYLNRRGEKHTQQSLVTSGIYSRIVPRTTFANLLLKIAGTLVYDSQVRGNAIVEFIKGRSHVICALNMAARESNYMLPALIRNFLFMISIGGNHGKTFLIKAALRANLVDLCNLVIH